MPSRFPPPGRTGARAPVRYSAELGRVICARIAAGESQHALSREAGMPSRRTFRDWALREPEFAAEYEAAKATARARQVAADREADQPRIWRRMLTRAGKRGGSVSIYTPELGEAICSRIAAGESVLAIADDAAMPCTVSIYNWARRNDEFRQMYLAAKDIAADMMFDLARDIALETTEATVRSDTLRIRTLRWHIAQLAPKKYGTRRALGPAPGEGDGEGEGGGPRTILNVTVRNFGEADEAPPAPFTIERR
ncbi:hypothetical protein [Phenylobacterium sp.]|uniref:terminase small subunit-like protein n=1 Tax=Phenylobacterium sp. TaxID=1871053 RepID=UPI00286B96D1|nr:hypothetical protein [Phenylobacterium sp.]